MIRNATASVGIAWADFGQSDAEVYGDVLYKDANGLAFRGMDVNNYLWARVRASVLEIGRKDAGADSVLATVPLFTAPADNRRYRIGVSAYGGK